MVLSVSVRGGKGRLTPYGSEGGIDYHLLAFHHVTRKTLETTRHVQTIVIIVAGQPVAIGTGCCNAAKLGSI